jgi:hypothetical protein
MTTLRYSPGTWQAVITPQGVALLPASVGSDMLDRIWASLDAGNGLGAVLESLTGAFGTSLSAIPPFAVATIIGSEVRLAVRGALAIEVEDAAASASAPLVVSGADVTTWSERVVSAGRRLTFRTPETDDEGSRYGIASGVVLCSAVAVDLEGAERPTESTQGGNAGGTASTARTAGGTPGASDNGAAGGNGSGAVRGSVRVDESSESEPVSAANHVSGAAPTGMPAVAPAESDEAPETTVIPEATILPGDDQHGQNGGSDATGTAAADAGLASSSPTSAASSSAPISSSTPASSSSATPVTASEDASAALPGSPEKAATPATETPGPAAEAPATDEDEVDDLSHTRTELPDDAYDHLWGATVVKSVEEAAVRESDDDDDEPEDGAHAAASSSAPKAPAPSARTASPPDATPSAATPGLEAGTSDGFAPPAPAVNASPATASGASPGTGAAAPLPPSGGLIDSVPNFRGVGAASGSDSVNGRTVPPSAALAAGASQPQAAPAGVPASAGAPAMPKATEVGDDHDGLTVTVSELEAMRRLGAAGGAGGEETSSATSALGRIALSTGESYTLDRPVIIGRRPRANRVQGDQVPVLVTVASPEQDISRNHLEIRLEGRHVLVVDLATTNGSVLHREGTPPLRLGPNEPVLVLTGDLVDIGDGVTVEFEEIP